MGRPIELIPLDNESTAVGAAMAAKEAVKKKVAAILGSSWSAHSLAIAPIAQAAKIPMISNYSSNPKLTLIGDYIFRMCYIDTFQAAVMARFARENLQLKKISILYEAGNDYSTDLANYFEKEFRRRGGEVVTKRSYLKDSLDYAAELGEIRQAKAEAIFLPGYEKEPGLIINQSYKMGMNLPVLGTDSWGDKVPKYVGGAIKEAYEVQAWNPEIPDPENQKFIREYQKKFGDKEEILAGVALAYDATLLLADAIRRAHSLSPRLIRDALARTENFVGISGRIRFDKNRNPIKPAVINRYLNSDQYHYYMTINP